jgi:hypothetical protein
MQLQIYGQQLDFQGFGFEDENCKKPYIFYEERYVVKSFSLKSGNSNEYNVNLSTKEISYTPLSDQVARALNEGSFCGLNEWQDHVKTTVTGGACNGDRLRKKEETYFQTLRLAENYISWGLLTNTLDGSSELKRPQAYEDLPFKK